MQKITPNLWFDRNAEEAADFYVSIFPNSKKISTMHYPNSEAEGLADFQKDRAGEVLTVEFELSGQRYIAINGGPEFKFTEAISLAVTCEDQDEIDYYWEKLSAIPEAEMCGWLKDRYGLSWQIVPKNVAELLKRPDAFTHMMNMKKLIIADY